MSPEVASYIDKPLNPETANDQACLKFVSMLIGGLRSDYIWGKTELLRYYHDMTWKEWDKIPHNRGGSPWMINLYFRSKQEILSDVFGIGGFYDPKDVIATWDREVENELRLR